jgi:hypothetical protein
LRLVLLRRASVGILRFVGWGAARAARRSPPAHHSLGRSFTSCCVGGPGVARRELRAAQVEGAGVS